MFHVLLPLDDNEENAFAATEAVISLLEAGGDVEVTILNVQSPVDVVDGEGGHADSEEWFDENEYPSSVIRAEERLQDTGIATTKHREHADPSKAIVSLADELGVDRIVMAGRKRTPVGKVLFGSTAQSVLLSATTPVTVVISDR